MPALAIRVVFLAVAVASGAAVAADAGRSRDDDSAARAAAPVFTLPGKLLNGHVTANRGSGIVEVDGQRWFVGGSAAVRWKDGRPAPLEALQPGVRVRLDILEAPSDLPGRVASIVVLPD